MSYFTQYEHQYNYNCKKIFYNKDGLIFRFPNQSQLYIYTELSLHEAQKADYFLRNKTQEVFLFPSPLTV